MKLVKLTGFNTLDHRDTSQVVFIDAETISSVVSSITADGYDYTTLTSGGQQYFVHETVDAVLEMMTYDGPKQ